MKVVIVFGSIVVTLFCLEIFFRIKGVFPEYLGYTHEQFYGLKEKTSKLYPPSREFFNLRYKDKECLSDKNYNVLNLTLRDYDYPQGMLIEVHESGKYADFISKVCERLCGHAQWEIMDQTKKTLESYTKKTKSSNKEVYKELMGYSKGPRCTFPAVSCRGTPCDFRKELALERLV